MTPSVTILEGSALDRLRELPSESIHCCVTSPPYWGLRDYGTPPQVWGSATDCAHEWGPPRKLPAVTHWNSGGEQLHGEERKTVQPAGANGQFCQRCDAWRGSLGLEPTPTLFVAHMVEIFEQVRRILRPDGTCWVNIGDCYATGAGSVGNCPGGGDQGARWAGHHPGRMKQNGLATRAGAHMGPMTQPNRLPLPGLKPKDLVGIPWMLAFALRDSGWWLRQEIIWDKPNPMPESTRDRCTKAHEQIFLLTKSARYFWDFDSMQEPAATEADAPRNRWDRDCQAPPGQKPQKRPGRSGNKERLPGSERGCPEGSGSNVQSHVPWEGSTRNKRSVWRVPTHCFREAHFATFPPDLIRPAIRAGCPVGGTVLDPFGGSGTTGMVALEESRSAILIELSLEYAAMARRRTSVTPGLPLGLPEEAAAP